MSAGSLLQALVHAAGRALAALLQEIDRLPPDTLRSAPQM